MGRTYAGILGPLALAVVVARTLVHGGAIEANLLSAWLALLIFAAIGFFVGQWAEWIVGDSVRSMLRLQAERAGAADHEPKGQSAA